jgi:hypothetical protein
MVQCVQSKNGHFTLIRSSVISFKHNIQTFLQLGILLKLFLEKYLNQKQFCIPVFVNMLLSLTLFFTLITVLVLSPFVVLLGLKKAVLFLHVL